MELEVINISYEIENDEGLSYLHFETKDGYYSISRLDEDDELYMELNEQSNGKYFSPDCFEFDFYNGDISFYVDEDRELDVGIYQNITLKFEPVDIERFKEMGVALEKIFKEFF